MNEGTLLRDAFNDMLILLLCVTKAVASFPAPQTPQLAGLNSC